MALLARIHKYTQLASGVQYQDAKREYGSTTYFKMQMTQEQVEVAVSNLLRAFARLPECTNELEKLKADKAKLLDDADVTKKASE